MSKASRFSDTPQLIPLANGKYITKSPMRYYVGYKGSEVWVDVPEGMKTDGLTLPWWAFWLRPFLPTWGKYGNAVLVHDYLTTNNGYLMFHGRRQKVNRKRADQIFHEGLIVLGMPKWVAKLFYWSVRGYAVSVRE